MRSQAALRALKVLCVMGISLCALPQLASAQLSLEILSPSPGSCVPNAEVAPGGQPGLPIEALLSPVSLSISVVEPNADPVSVSATLNGQPLTLNFEALIIDQANTAQEINVLEIAAEDISDGLDHQLSLTISSPAGSVTQSVTFDLDRLPPTVTFSEAELALLGSCSADAASQIAAISPVVSDAFDPSPTFETVTSANDCEVVRSFIATDHCGEDGNNIVYFFGMKSPYTGPASLIIEGVEEGGSYLEAYPSFSMSEAEQCFELSGELTVAGGEAETAVNNRLIDSPGDYQLTVNALDCSGQGPSSAVNFTVLEPPKAIIGGPYTVTQGQTVTLDGSQSTCPPELGGIVEYAWDFDLDNPFTGYARVGELIDFVTYDAQTGDSVDDGVYRVGLRVMSEQGQLDFAETTVTVEDALPTCDAGGPYEVAQGEELTFDGSGSAEGVPSEPIIAYRWVFDDSGLFGSEQYGPSIVTPTYLFYEEGLYEVELTVQDLDLSSCTTTTLVTVNDVDPVVSGLSIVSPPPYREGEPVTFSAGTTQAGGTGVEPIISFVWSWGDGSDDSVSAPSAELRRPTHSFINSGSFQVCLTVDDGDSDAQGCLPITVEDISPRIIFSGDIFAIEGEEAHFTMAGTRAGGPTDPLDRVEIDWGDGMVDVISGAALSETDLSHRFEADGDITVVIRAYDEDSFSESIWELYVDDVSPQVSFRLIDEPAEEGVSATLDASASAPGAPSDQITTYSWDFGDGTSLSGGVERAVVTHTWPDDGTYLVRLVLGDSDEAAASSLERLITVRNRAPYNASIITAAETVDIGLPTRFEVRYEDVLDDSVSIYWRMGEGTEFFDQSVVSHSYSELGIYTVRVELTDEDGGVTLITRDVEVTPAGPQLVIEEPEATREGETLSLVATVVPAVSGEGGVDGPAELRVLRAPEGMSWLELEPEGLAQRYRFVWPTSAGDAGAHILRVRAVAPSGIERSAELELEVEEALEASLVTLGGRPERALVSFFAYERDQDRSLTSLEERARVEVGRGIGQMSLHAELPAYLFVSAPTSGHVAVLSLGEGRLLRRIPLRGTPYALASLGGYLWSFDARDGRVSAIDSRLKVTRQLTIPELKGVSAAIGRVVEGQPYLFVHDHDGGLWVLDPEAILSNQASRAALRAHDLNLSLDAWERAARGEAPPEEGELTGPVARRGGASLLWDGERAQLLVSHARGVVGYSPEALLDAAPAPSWSLKSAAHLRSLALYRGALWGTSNQGLRRFELPSSGLVEGADGVGELLDLNGQQTLSAGPERLLGEPSLIVGGARSLQHLSASSLRPLLNSPEPNPQQLIFLLR